MKKDQDPPKYPPGLKPLALKPIDVTNLPKLEAKYDLPKPPSVYPKKEEESQFKDKKAFSLRNLYNTESFGGRFRAQLARIHPR